jgi:hypothetical protein
MASDGESVAGSDDGTKATPPRGVAGGRVRGILVIGMHRSGTSCLTGLLEEAGVHLGDVSKWNPHNRRGNQEHPEVVAVNEAVLAANRAAWDRPPEGECHWGHDQRHRRDAILAAYDGHEPWAIKDPRTLLTLAGWLEGAADLHLVATFRHPLAVARSLQARGRGELADWLDLWIRYNRRLLRVLEARPCPLVCFDTPAPLYLQRVRQVLESLGLTLPVDPGFFDEHLRTHDADLVPEPLPAECLELYCALRAHAHP